MNLIFNNKNDYEKSKIKYRKKVIVGIPGQGHNVKVNTPVMIRVDV